MNDGVDVNFLALLITVQGKVQSVSLSGRFFLRRKSLSRKPVEPDESLDEVVKSV